MHKVSKMRQNICKNCGAHDFFEENGHLICQYCNSKFLISKEDISRKSSTISLGDDVKMLLKKCHDDPSHAYRYAMLILDIDPTNEEATKYLGNK